ncbi:MAG: O-antigen ligase family protein, partial [Methylococcales bacterium]
AITGRTTEMLAALHVFLDHPILGVGPGQYNKFYSVKYQTNPDIAFRYLNYPRRAHSIYTEIPAELGILGFIVFMAIGFVNLHQLWLIRVQTLHYYPEIANLSSAFLMGIAAYFMTAIFLHFSYQRYYWLLLAISGAAIQIFKKELDNNTANPEP